MVKKYQVVISSQAQKSLDHIVDYIADNASNETAKKVEKGLLEAALNLTKFPHRHLRSCTELRKARFTVTF